MIFKLGELFCGPGGLAWGATHADIGNPEYKIVHAWANDYDENTCKHTVEIFALMFRRVFTMLMSENSI